MPHFGLPRTARLRQRRQFLAIQARGLRVRGQFMVAIGSRVPPLQAALPTRTARLGITASKKVGDAVQRNRAKRLIREAFRHLRAGLPPWLDVVIIAKDTAPTAAYLPLRAELERGLQRLVQQLDRPRRPAPPRER